MMSWGVPYKWISYSIESCMLACQLSITQEVVNFIQDKQAVCVCGGGGGGGWGGALQKSLKIIGYLLAF